ncbi:MAG: hypothetical protein WBI20_08825 [Burkholderiaceae bacterium]
MSDIVLQARELASQLSNMLELEFQALRSQDLDQFEQLQPVKNELLSEIKRVALVTEEMQTGSEWQDFRETMGLCRDFHRRNVLLMDRKLESIRGTLQSLRMPEMASSVEVYNRLGHIARFSRNTAYSDA